MQKLGGKTFNIVKDNIEKLKEIFPEVFIENKVDIDKLRIALGEHIEKEKERYEFKWNGKIEAIQLAQKQTTGTLRPCKEESVNWDATQNIYIEGDNLEVLRILQNSYRNKIKRIYIDPPYNTGNDFVYNDNFKDNITNYKEKMQDNLKSNPETNGRFHTNWLNMIYPRLLLARNLLHKKGLIFISIDDNEFGNLKQIMNEIFGEENFVTVIKWEKRFTRSNNAKQFASMLEYLLVYRKSSEVQIIREPRDEKADSIYTNPDNDPRGIWTSVSYVNPASKEDRPNLSYELINPIKNEKVVHPTNAWKYSKEVHLKHVEEERLYWGKNGENIYPRLKRFLSELDDGMVPIDFWDRKKAGTTDEASKELGRLMGGKVFDFPKPVQLINKILDLTIDGESGTTDIILDFFSGSSTTAHAVLQRNSEDNGKRRYILIQFPEKTDEKSEAYKMGYKNICEIGKDRIRRAGNKIAEETKGKENQDLDIGFKVFKLDETNLKVWDEESMNLEKNLLDLVEPIKQGRTQEDVVYEILLKYGIDLTVPIEKISVAGITVYSIGMGYLLICLEQDLSLEQIEEMAKKQPERIVFYDEGFKNDTVRTNAQQILKRYGVEDIRVI